MANISTIVKGMVNPVAESEGSTVLLQTLFPVFLFRFGHSSLNRETTIIRALSYLVTNVHFCYNCRVDFSDNLYGDANSQNEETVIVLMPVRFFHEVQ